MTKQGNPKKDEFRTNSNVYAGEPLTSFYEKLLLNPLSANPTKWLNTLKQFVGSLTTNCLSVFDHFVGLALKGLKVRERNECTTA